MSPLFSPFTAHSEEEPSSWVGDALLAVAVVFIASSVYFLFR
jgi:hypothetical protein